MHGAVVVEALQVRHKTLGVGPDEHARGAASRTFDRANAVDYVWPEVDKVRQVVKKDTELRRRHHALRAVDDAFEDADRRADWAFEAEDDANVGEVGGVGAIDVDARGSGIMTEHGRPL